MSLIFFGGSEGQGAQLWSADKSATDRQDPEQLRARVRELEALCAEVLIAGVDVGLPQHLLNQLWTVVGRGELPHAFSVDLPPAAHRAPVPDIAAEATAQNLKADSPEVPDVVRSAVVPSVRPSLEIPDISLTSNPLLVRNEAHPKPPQPDLTPIGVRKTVAIVDDDPMMLDVLSRILQRENYEILLASGGPELIRKLSRLAGCVDLLVTDYAMPDMKGRELAERVRQQFPDVRILYQTGFSDLLFEDRAELEEGAAFLEKPFTARGLREAARLVLFGSINP